MESLLSAILAAKLNSANFQKIVTPEISTTELVAHLSETFDEKSFLSNLQTEIQLTYNLNTRLPKLNRVKTLVGRKSITLGYASGGVINDVGIPSANIQILKDSGNKQKALIQQWLDANPNEKSHRFEVSLKGRSGEPDKKIVFAIIRMVD